MSNTKQNIDMSVRKIIKEILIPEITQFTYPNDFSMLTAINRSGS